PVTDSVCLWGGQVLVFHFPRVVHRVKRGVPNQVSQRPGPGHLALGMELPNGFAVGVAVRLQALVGQHRAWRSEHPDLSRPLLLRAERVTDNVVPIAPSPPADPSAAPPTRASARRRRAPSTPASASADVPLLRSTCPAGRCPKRRTRSPRS